MKTNEQTNERTQSTYRLSQYSVDPYVKTVVNVRLYI